jgi:hypothetical protein
MTFERKKSRKGEKSSQRVHERFFQNFTKERLAEKYTELYPLLYEEKPIPGEDHHLSFLGMGGDCGNFAIALNRHLGNKGNLLACINTLQSYEELVISHVILEYNGMILDCNGIHFPDPRGIDDLKYDLAEQWVDDPNLWEFYSDKYVWDELDRDKRLKLLEPIMISVTEEEIKEKLNPSYYPRTTYEDRIVHLRDFFCHLEGNFKFNPVTRECMKTNDFGT